MPPCRLIVPELEIDPPVKLPDVLMIDAFVRVPPVLVKVPVLFSVPVPDTEVLFVLEKVPSLFSVPAVTDTLPALFNVPVPLLVTDPVPCTCRFAPLATDVTAFNCKLPSEIVADPALILVVPRLFTPPETVKLPPEFCV